MDGDEDDRPRDRWFDPYRIPYSPLAASLVADVVNQVGNYEEHFSTRTRARRQDDQAVFQGSISAIVCDLAYNYLLDPAARIAITRSNKVLGTSSRYRPVTYSKALPKLLDKMASELMFVVQELGYSKYEGGAGARRTTIRAGRSLISRIEDFALSLDDFTKSAYQEILVLKRVKSDYFDEGGLLEYVDTQCTDHLRSQLSDINQWLASAEIEFDPDAAPGWHTDDQMRQLRRIFTNGRFDSGGKLFGGFWQDLSKQLRLKELFINGESVVELDYAQMAPRIVYGMKQAKLPRW